jgi:hypothetical protein
VTKLEICALRGTVLMRIAATSFIVAAGLRPDHLAAQVPTMPPAHCQADDQRVEVLMVGSYHMSNPGLDGFNLQADDVRTPQRQEEIAALVDKLMEFGPTKVAVEAPYGDSATIERYGAFVLGEHELGRGESEQIGFRLAAKLGHTQVYPIDVSLRMNFESLGPIVGAHPEFQRKMMALDSLGNFAIETMARWLKEGTVAETLHEMNRPEFIELAHQPYIEVLARIVDGENYAGADMVADWYKRNIRIFANLTRITDSPDDRIFVIYGQGHIKILRDLVVESPDYCVVDPLPFLKTR